MTHQPNRREFNKAALAAVMIGMPDDNERRRDAKRRRSKRDDVKEVVIPKCASKSRRTRLEKDDVKWLRYYFGVKSGCDQPFWYDFTSQQREMIAAIRHAILYGGDQSIAASRGEGKTTLCERLLLKYTLQGSVSFPVLFSATAVSAAHSLTTIKMAIEENDFLLADYPEVCVPVRALENTPQRAKYQTVTGVQCNNARKKFERVESRFSWCGTEVIFPHVPGSPSSGAVIATRGLDSAVRGIKVNGQRPDVSIIDDPDTVDSARSEDQAAKLRGKIDKDIGGLGGQQRGIARVLLTTLQSRVSVSYQLTDPSLAPGWKPKRFRFLVKPPERRDMWDEYVAMRHQDYLDGDDFARRSHQFYLDNRAKMDAGAVVANKHRYDNQKLPDGSQAEVSALQRYFNEVAKIGLDAVATELDNDPPEEAGPVESALRPSRVQRQLSGYPRCVIPEDTVCLVQGLDIGKMAFHWVVRAWRKDCVGYTVAHGVHEVHGTVAGSDEGLDQCIRRAILSRYEEMQEQFCKPDGEVVPIDMTLVDARYRTEAVYAACREIGVGFRPAMGFGRSQGCVRATFSEFQRTIRTAARTIRPGDGTSWYEEHKSGLWVVNFFADKWKNWEHDRWLTDPGMSGCLLNYGKPGEIGRRMSDDEKDHHAYAHHICNEKEVEELQKDGSTKRYWKVRGPNHWLDASAMSDVAAAIMGISLLGQNQVGARQAASGAKRKSLAEMAAGA